MISPLSSPDPIGPDPVEPDQVVLHVRPEANFRSHLSVRYPGVGTLLVSLHRSRTRVLLVLLDAWHRDAERCAAQRGFRTYEKIGRVFYSVTRKSAVVIQRRAVEKYVGGLRKEVADAVARFAEETGRSLMVPTLVETAMGYRLAFPALELRGLALEALDGR